ncbi:hypothetical protein CC86DRAFT_41067 [Ophiobolus disseminans]|uniref:Uncharacterized protein n=1 Tax=Ophiobolus disseminans TaxID=1469910 RepID=A0A6A6ZWQ2_9PLEO|nr:hypothetical protein CC86DRAFT_41067 [Ophiobolus disseminans]
MYEQSFPQPGAMNFNMPSPSQEFMPVKDDGQELMHMGQPNDHQTRLESSEDDGPIMARRKTQEQVKKRRHHGRDSGDLSLGHPILRHPEKPQKSSPKSAGKQKKPGPKPWATKPITKNDTKAKMELVREIEGLWGKGFIKAFFPRCHRPLVKRGKSGKRSGYRHHEANPMNWLPSVLKAILNLAKLTDDKEWLKKAMNVVVRHRIKHTGNRKPQLVTTDFDVIEDMLVKEWDVAYSFSIRYKHLLVHQKEEEEDEENIDHILQAGSDHDESGQDNNDEDDVGDQEDDNDSSDDQDQGRGGISGKYLQSSGYTPASTFISPSPAGRNAKPRKETPIKQSHGKQSPPPQQPGIYGYGAHMPGYIPQFDHWGRPVPMPMAMANFGRGPGPGGYPGGYNGYGGGHGGNGGYGLGLPPHGGDDRQGSQQPLARGMPQYPHPHHAMTPAPSIPDSDYSAHGNNLQRSHDSPFMQGYPNSYQDRRPKIKRESPPVDERPMPVQDMVAPPNDLADQDNEDDDEDDGDDHTNLEAQLEAAKIRLRIAKIKAKMGRRKKS